MVAIAVPATAQDLPEASKARMIAQEVLKETRAVLEGALAQGDAATALRACAAVAQNLARKHEQEGWRVRRVSEKVRNVADTPDPAELEVLQRWASAQAAGQLKPTDEHEAIVTEAGRRHYHYMRPIVIPGALCLQCHGAPEQLAPAVRDALRELYPADQATGYKVGDLRGAVSVKIPLSSER
jgi:hypothetical protein